MLAEVTLPARRVFAKFVFHCCLESYFLKAQKAIRNPPFRNAGDQLLNTQAPGYTLNFRLVIQISNRAISLMFPGESTFKALFSLYQGDSEKSGLNVP